MVKREQPFNNRQKAFCKSEVIMIERWKWKNGFNGFLKTV
jgi:hypothetical protein